MPATDFEFLAGHFRVRNRRLAQRLVDCDEWLSFEMEFWGWPVMGGAAFYDETNGVVDGKDFWGMTLRLHDPTTDLWSLHWSDTWNPRLYPPLTGKFEAGQGQFFGEDVEGGQAVRVRFVWSGMEAGQPRWEQAFSVAEGQTWEINWTMDFDRLGDAAQPNPKRVP